MSGRPTCFGLEENAGWAHCLGLARHVRRRVYPQVAPRNARPSSLRPPGPGRPRPECCPPGRATLRHLKARVDKFRSDTYVSPLRRRPMQSTANRVRGRCGHNALATRSSKRGPTCGNAMLAELHTCSLLSIEAIPVDVEVDVSPATIPKTILVGLPEAAVRPVRRLDCDAAFNVDQIPSGDATSYRKGPTGCRWCGSRVRLWGRRQQTANAPRPAERN